MTMLVAVDQAGRAAEAPLADSADVDVDEVGARIIAHAAAMERESGLAQPERVDARHAQVDRFRVGVKAVLSDTGGVSAKRFVCRRGAVAADDVDLAGGVPDRRRESRQDVVQARIEMANVAGSMIAQEIIEFGKSAWNVLVAVAVNNIKPFTRVRVVEHEEMIPALLRRRGRFAQLGACATRRHQQQQSGCNRETPRNYSRCAHIYLSTIVPESDAVTGLTGSRLFARIARERANDRRY